MRDCPKCPKCGNPLQPVRQGSNSMLNEYQFGNAPYAYFWDKEVAQPVCEAPAPAIPLCICGDGVSEKYCKFHHPAPQPSNLPPAEMTAHSGVAVGMDEEDCVKVCGKHSVQFTKSEGDCFICKTRHATDLEVMNQAQPVQPTTEQVTRMVEDVEALCSLAESACDRYNMAIEPELRGLIAGVMDDLAPWRTK